jgi:hypothetical protein
VTEDSDSQFFQKMADSGHYGKRARNKSRQGIYVFTAEGKFLASINNLSADLVLKMMERGLSEWEQLPAARQSATVSVKPPKHRWEDSYPRDGLVLNVHSRDLPLNHDMEAERLPTWNRDSAWFSKQEAASIVPDDAKVGDEFELPAFFVNRVSRWHLVDFVKGQTEDFKIREIKDAVITAEVVKRESDSVTLSLAGKTNAQVGSNGRGMSTKLLGQAKFDTQNATFTTFKLVALGQRWGKTQFNDRRRQMDKTPIGFVFEMAAQDATPIIPGIIWSYDAPWIKQPD